MNWKTELSTKVYCFFELEVTRPAILDIEITGQVNAQVDLSIYTEEGNSVEEYNKGPFHDLHLSPGIYTISENYHAEGNTHVVLVIHAVPVEEEPECPVEMSPYTPNTSHSYITSIVPVMAQTTPDSLRYPGKAIHSINYYDGLGRPEQTVQYGSFSPMGRKTG